MAPLADRWGWKPGTAVQQEDLGCCCCGCCGAYPKERNLRESHPQAWGVWIPLHPVLASPLFMGMIYLLALNRPCGTWGTLTQSFVGLQPKAIPSTHLSAAPNPWHRESCWHPDLSPSSPGDRAGDTQPPGDTLARGSIPAGIHLKQGEVQPFTMEKLPRLAFEK